jgi:hypothetical protein
MSTHALTMHWARLRYRLGVAGPLGLGMVVASLAIATSAWRAQSRPLSQAEAVPPTPSAPTLIAQQVQPTSPRPTVADVPLLLSRIERAAVAEGLGWPRADYRVTAATNELPASLEVRCTLEGPYLALRRFVTAVLLDAPTATLKEFGLSRPNTETPVVQARLTFVVYLASDAAGSAR